MKLKSTLFLSIFIGFIGFTQTKDAVLSSGNWFKFSVDTTGVFKIDKNLLQQIGLSTANLNPKKIHIYGNGGNLLPLINGDFRYNDLQENAIFISGENDGSFDTQDFILFYAKGPHDWEINANVTKPTHRQNIYSNKGYYFISVDETDGKRITTKPEITANASTQITTFDDYIFYEKENVNLIAAGQQWFGEDFSIESTRTFTIPFPNAVPNEIVSVRTRAVAVSSLSSSMTVKANGQNLYDLSFFGISGGSLNQASTSDRSAAFSNVANKINVEITYNNGGIPSAKAYLDFIEIVGKKELKATDFQFSFRSFEASTANGIVAYQIDNASAIAQLWDVTDFLNPKIISSSSPGNTFNFKANGGVLNEYVILTSSDFYIPKTIRNAKVKNQNLHALKDINYIVITNNELSNQAQRLADYHANNSGLTTKVVLLDEIYNEFSSGSKDITGIRDFINYIYKNNSSPEKKLQYVCFFGDSSYDFKDRIPANNNIVPAFQSFESFNLATSYVTDDFFVMLGDTEGNMNRNHTIDVASSRVPVSTIQEAKQVVDKILSYYQLSSFGDWRNTITLLADDIDDSFDISIQSGVERIADTISKNNPVFNLNKIYADAYVQENSSGGERYPAVKEAITNAIEKGTLIFNYFGHGGEDGFASERILEKGQINAFVNEKTLPLFITVTCDFSRFDNPNRITAGELTFLNPVGGAANMITTTREVFISTGQTFNEQLMKTLLDDDNSNLSIAQALAKAKNNFTDSEQKFFIYNFGDPAAKLAIPEANVRITKMNGKSISQQIDTLKALSKVSFEGIVTDNNDNILPNFNGTVSTTIFDKPINKTTLDNDNFGVFLEFDSQESKLYRGKSSVTNGAFTFDFIVPKDVKVAFGKGKLSFYAENSVIDKSGYSFDVTVGGINENAIVDNTGPEIKLFLNDESFIDGGNTNTSPNLIAHLFDSSGINTSITAVDHDIIGILDGDQSNPIVLNDFYETELDDFTNGKVSFKLRNLKVGNHTLEVKACDTYNNCSKSSLNFMVVSDAIFNLENVLNYPNPFVNYTEFWFNHNKPNEALEVQVQIFTVSGKLVKTINQSVITSGTLSRSIAWNGLDDFGNKIGKGVYVYKLKVKSTVSNLVAEKYEKLVILQ